jgi:hypothetical protein
MPAAAFRQHDRNLMLGGVPVTPSAADLNTLAGLAATGAVLKTALVTVTTAQLLALFATPVALVAAPGAGRALIFEGAIAYKPAGTAYAGVAAGEDLSVKYTDAAGAAVGGAEATGFLDQATAQTRYIRATGTASGVSDITPVANAALVLHMLTGEVITGDSDLTLRIFYRDIPTTL